MSEFVFRFLIPVSRLCHPYKSIEISIHKLCPPGNDIRVGHSHRTNCNVQCLAISLTVYSHGKDLPPWHGGGPGVETLVMSCSCFFCYLSKTQMRHWNLHLYINRTLNRQTTTRSQIRSKIKKSYTGLYLHLLKITFSHFEIEIDLLTLKITLNNQNSIGNNLSF